MTESSEEYGPTDVGFVQRFYSDIVADKRTRAIESFGTSIDLTDTSVFGQFINSMSYEEALIWQILENTYYCRYIQFATGKALDDVVYAKGLFRKSGAKSSGYIKVTKDSGYTKRIYIPVGTTVSDADGLYPFVTTEEAEFAADTTTTTITIPVLSVNIGENYNVPAKKIEKFVSTLNGISLVENEEATTGGSDTETDSELRLRAINYKPGSVATKSAIVDAVMIIDGVYGVNIKEYFTKTTGLSYVTMDNITLTEVDPNTFIVFVNCMVDDESVKTKILDTVENIRAYGVKGYCVDAKLVPLTVEFNGEYTGTASDLAKSIKSVCNDVFDNAFGGTVTYMNLMKPISNLSSVSNITSLKFTITFSATSKVVLEKFGDSIDMSGVDKIDKYINATSVKINGVDPSATE